MGLTTGGFYFGYSVSVSQFILMQFPCSLLMVEFLYFFFIIRAIQTLSTQYTILTQSYLSWYTGVYLSIFNTYSNEEN